MIFEVNARFYVILAKSGKRSAFPVFQRNWTVKNRNTDIKYSDTLTRAHQDVDVL